MKIKARTLIGTAITMVWLIGLAYVFSIKGGLGGLLALPLNEIGDFLAGAFAPLAFIWFVIAYAQQGEELRQNTAALSAQYEEMKKAAEQSAIQAQAIKANELHARRDTFFRYAELVLMQINSVTGNLALSSFDRDYKNRWYGVFAAGDKYVFFDLVIAYLDNLNGYPKWRDNVYNEYSGEVYRKQFFELYETLMRECAKCDDDYSIRLAFRNSSMGKLYLLLCKDQGREPFGLSSSRDDA